VLSGRGARLGFSARIRVSGAITRRCLSWYGPILSGENNDGKFMPAPENADDYRYVPGSAGPSKAGRRYRAE
jgi:hypothetical protein